MSKLRVLIVDDNRITLNNVANALEHANIHYKTCMDSTKAIEDIYSFKPTLIILDIHMPKLSGIDLCKQIKEDANLSHTMVIFLSASTSYEDILKGVKLHVVDYINKEVPVKELLEHILSRS